MSNEIERTIYTGQVLELAPIPPAVKPVEELIATINKFLGDNTESDVSSTTPTEADYSQIERSIELAGQLGELSPWEEYHLTRLYSSLQANKSAHAENPEEPISQGLSGELYSNTLQTIELFISRGEYEKALRLSLAILPITNRVGSAEWRDLLLKHISTCFFELDANETEKATFILNNVLDPGYRNDGLKEVVRRLINQGKVGEAIQVSLIPDSEKVLLLEAVRHLTKKGQYAQAKSVVLETQILGESMNDFKIECLSEMAIVLSKRDPYLAQKTLLEALKMLRGDSRTSDTSADRPQPPSNRTFGILRKKERVENPKPVETFSISTLLKLANAINKVGGIPERQYKVLIEKIREGMGISVNLEQYKRNLSKRRYDGLSLFQVETLAKLGDIAAAVIIAEEMSPGEERNKALEIVAKALLGLRS